MRAFEPFAAIHAFLDEVRDRLRRRLGRLVVTAVLAAIATVAVLLPLIAAWTGESGAAPLRGLGIVVLVGGALVGFVGGVVLPRRRWRDDVQVARLVGVEATHVASGLLSTVELERELGAGQPGFSPDLAAAHAGEVAARLSTLDLAVLISPRPLRRATRALLGAAALNVAAAALFPAALALGWRRIVAARVLPDGGPVLVDEPLVGDITLSLEFPAYLKRAPLVVPAAAGDLTAPRGTKVNLETTALRPFARARLVWLGEGGVAPAAIPLVAAGKQVTGAFSVDRAGSYRFELEPESGETVAEATPHRVEVEPDRAPRVELVAPADELEVGARRRLELMYSVEDDHGISELALVWRSASGREQRKVLAPPKAGARTAQARFVWDLADVPLEPGARIAYHLEAKDNDDVSGPNVGASKTFTLRVFSPREKHQQLVEDLARLADATLAALADRLELPADLPIEAHRAAAEATARIVGGLGELTDATKKDPLGQAKLAADLEEMRGRLAKLIGDEGPLLGERGQPASKERRAAMNGRFVPELERDVLALRDWLERQRLEQALAITDEIKRSREKIASLLDDLARTNSPEARAELERELRALESRIAELEHELGKLGGDTVDRFVNREALEDQRSAGCVAEVRAKVAAGDLEGAKAALAKCSKELDQRSAALEQGLGELRGEKFSEEEKARAELMKEVSALEEDQGEVARATDRLLERYKKEAAEAAKGQAREARERAKKLLDKAKRRLEDVPERGLSDFGKEERAHLRKRLEDTGRMLDEGDAAEALAMARQAQQSLDTMSAEIADDLSDGEPSSDQTEEAGEALGKARAPVKELIGELESAVPKVDEVMDQADQQALRELQRRQGGLEQRTKRLMEQLEKGGKGKSLPGRAGQAASEGLGQAAEQMGRASGRFGAKDPLGARDEASGAAEKLAQLRKGMNQASRPTTVSGEGGGRDDEPIKIPGRDDFKPPEEFREDILDAMKKERAPEAYREQVKRYYEELVK